MATLDFEFYKDKNGIDHKELFINQVTDKCPEFLPNIQDYIDNGIEVNTLDFYIYSLFENFNIASPDFSSLKGFDKIVRIRGLN